MGPAPFALAIHDPILRARNDTAIAHPDGVDFVSFYLDDGVFVGTGDVVAHSSKLSGAPLAGGLVLSHSPNKGTRPNRSSGHTQGALHLLRNCASFSKVARAMRAAPSALQQAPLQYFNADIDGVLEELVGKSVP